MKTFYLGMLAILLLTGCVGPVHQMAKEGNAPFIGGELIHDRGKSNRLVLQTPNRRYEANGFAVEHQTDLAVLRKRYFIADRKHWDRIFAGLDAGHEFFSIETIAVSAEGPELSCRLIWASLTKPAGVCTDQTGAAFPVRFE
ncbi:MAG: hypothetical protein HY846_01475 [Nitrosomonadales bacterium]|nr:hypothetical protein [Nitrosomonadales bacterium]